MKDKLLKPCPFCGSEAEIERKGNYNHSMIIGCTNCGVKVESGDVFGSTNPENYAWNTRTGELAPTQPCYSEDELLAMIDDKCPYETGSISMKEAIFNSDHNQIKRQISRALAGKLQQPRKVGYESLKNILDKHLGRTYPRELIFDIMKEIGDE